jgi:hypothetical protein
MSLYTHIEALEKKHTELKAAVAAEIAHPLPDFSKVTLWKKQKLKIKEELQRLREDADAA